MSQGEHSPGSPPQQATEEPGSTPARSVGGARAILDQMGGVRGLIYSTLPVAVFVPVSSAFGLMPAIAAWPP